MKHILIAAGLILLSFLAVMPLFHSGFFPVHDTAQPARVFEMHQSLVDGMFPVRWVKDLGYGYGYPLFNFYAPFAYYVGSIFMFLGSSALVSTKIVFGIAIILAGIFMYLLAKEFWGTAGGIVSAVLFIYAPYHAVETYVRGDLAELFAYVLVPLTFLSFYKIIDASEIHYLHISTTHSKRVRSTAMNQVWFWIFISSLALAVLILSHNLTAFMVCPFLFIFVLLQFVFSKTHKPLTLYFLLFAGFLGIVFSAFYWLPVFGEMQYTNVLSQTGGGFDFHQHFVCWSQLWSSPWGYGGSAPGCTQDGLSFMVGKISLLFAAAGFLSSFFFGKEKRQQYSIWIGSGLLIIAAVFSTEMSKPVWEFIHVMSFFQFPWRFLVMMTFFACFLSGAVFRFISLKVRMPQFGMYGIVGVVLLAVLVVQGKYFRAEEFLPPSFADFSPVPANLLELSRASSEYMPTGFVKPSSPVELPEKTFLFMELAGNFFSQQHTTTHASAHVFVRFPTTIHLNIAYFPAWHVRIAKSEIPIAQVANGMNISVPAGNYTITASFISTPIETAANYISFGGVIVLILGIMLVTRFHPRNISFLKGVLGSSQFRSQ